MLPYNYVGVYGLGTSEGKTGIETSNTLNRFATIYFVGANMGASMIGQSILFKEENEVCRLSWDSFLYPVLHRDSIIATEIIP